VINFSHAGILASHRRSKADRLALGKCETSATHGKATHGRLCKACRTKKRALDAKRVRS